MNCMHSLKLVILNSHFIPIHVCWKKYNFTHIVKNLKRRKLTNVQTGIIIGIYKAYTDTGQGLNLNYFFLNFFPGNLKHKVVEIK